MTTNKLVFRPQDLDVGCDCGLTVPHREDCAVYDIAKQAQEIHNQWLDKQVVVSNTSELSGDRHWWTGTPTADSTHTARVVNITKIEGE